MKPLAGWLAGAGGGRELSTEVRGVHFNTNTLQLGQLGISYVKYFNSYLQ